MAAIATCKKAKGATGMKRLVRERERFPTESSEFHVCWKDDNLRQFEAYIVGPDDSVYKHKLIKLKFDVPQEYPLVPPKVKFVQHQGDRIHPNLYADGKVCLSILGTWSGDPWSYSMTIESILITIRSLLDNKPYTHEPHQGDNPEFNKYVRYNTWRWLLLDYVEREQDAEAKTFLVQYITKHGAEMVKELERQKYAYDDSRELVNPYAMQNRKKADYDRLLVDLKRCVSENTGQVVGAMPLQNQLLTPQHDNPSTQGKRKASDDIQNDSPPKKKLPQELCVVDLTGDD